MWSSTVHKSTLQSQKWLGLSHYNLKNNLNAISKTTEWSLFISKANHSISQWSKSMPWPIMLKNLKLALRRPIKPSRTNTPNRCPFHYRGLECKSRKSRNTWSNGQIWPWSTEWNRAKANRVLPREHTGHNKHPLPTTEEKTLHMDITRWSTLKSDWLYSLQPKMEKLCTVSKNNTRSWLWLRSWTLYCQIQIYIEESKKPLDHSGMT